MTIDEEFARENILIDPYADVLFGDDQCFLNYPARYPTVGFALLDTDGLTEIADRMRKGLGFKPMHPVDDLTEDDCDNNGWYNFYVGLNGFSKTQVDSCIEFVVVDSGEDDNETCYTIDLSEDEQLAIYKQLDAQCRELLGKGCADLLATAEKMMLEDYGEVD